VCALNRATLPPTKLRLTESDKILLKKICT